MKAYEDFETLERVALETETYSHERNPEQYFQRIKNKQPIRAPRFKVGQFVYSSLHDANVPVLYVEWDNGHIPGWRICTPGHGGGEDSFSNPLALKPTKIFKQLDNGYAWEPIGQQPPIRR